MVLQDCIKNLEKNVPLQVYDEDDDVVIIRYAKTRMTDRGVVAHESIFKLRKCPLQSGDAADVETACTSWLRFAREKTCPLRRVRVPGMDLELFFHETRVFLL